MGQQQTAVLAGVTQKKPNFLTQHVARLNRNRLGELLVSKGKITTTELQDILAEQRVSGLPLGEILCHHGLLTIAELRTSLWQQIAYRSLAGIFAFALGLSATGVSPAQATSSLLRSDTNAARSLPETKRDEAKVIPAAINRNETRGTRPDSRIENFPLLFGSLEIRSRDIGEFDKFTSVMGRLQTAMRSNSKVVAQWESDIAKLRGLPLEDMARKVNTMMNAVAYIEDKQNYGKSDYWATPDQFLARGGDCEDYAIAKYASLKALGVAEDRMRIAIVQDTWKDIAHSVLVVYTDSGIMILDNQNKNVLTGSAGNRYTPIYSINQQAWWRHLG